MSGPGSPPNVLTVDVEDWFHILELDGGYRREDWDALESRVVANTERLLAIFDEAGAQATFFVVGWIAERNAGLVRRIADLGHELGSHSYWHEVVGRHSRASFQVDLERSKKLIEDLSGAAVRGYRAPGGSITPATAWAFDAIAAAGYAFDSSTWPTGLSSHGGFPTPFRGPHRLRTSHGELFEFPASSVQLGGWRVPYAGGGWLRLFPLSFLLRAIAWDNHEGRPANVYLHPREIDPDQPRMDLPPLRRFKYYVGLRSTEAKLRRILRDFRFVSASAWLESETHRCADQLFDVRQQIAASPAPDVGPAAAPPPPPAVT